MAAAAKYALIPVLVAISALGFYATVVGIAGSNFGDAVQPLKDGQTDSIPGMPAPFRTHFTGIAAVDGQLSTLVAFFAGLVDGVPGHHVTAFAIYGLAQFGAAWTLLVLESKRVASRGRLVSWVGTLGAAMQNLTFVFCVPLYLVLHLLTSPAAAIPRGDGPAARGALFVPLWDLALLTCTVTLTYIAPSMLMLRPSLFGHSASFHYGVIALWQFFPLLTVAAQGLLHRLCYYGLGTLAPRDADGKATTPGRAYTVAAAAVYEFLLTICVASHLPILLLSLAPGFLRDFVSLWATPTYATVLDQVTFSATFVPHAPWSSPVVEFPLRAGGLAPISLNFLQWDLHLGCAALLLWALYLNYATAPGSRSLPSLLGKAALWTALGGTTAAAVVLIRDRDTAVLENEPEPETRKKDQ